MLCVFLPLVARMPRRLSRRLVGRVALVAVAFIGLAAGRLRAAPPPELAGSGAATVPADAAFFSASLRLKDQYDRILGSNAFAALRALPGVQRALASWEEQREMPGSPVSMFLTFLEPPENDQAAQLLADMVASDTFVYGTDSWVGFARLVRAVQRAQQSASMLQGAAGGGLLELEELEMIEEDDAEAAAFPPGIVPVRRQVETFAVPVDTDQTTSILRALADNPELIAVPDVVWGFLTTKKDIATFQIKRLEVLAKMLVEANPALAGSLARRPVPGGEVVTLTLDGALLPWNEIESGLEEQVGDDEELGRKLGPVIDRAKKLDLVIAIGLVGDRVILSLGDSADHLAKLVRADGGGRSLIDTPAFEPVRDHASKPLTGIMYVSQPLAAAMAASADDLDPLLAGLEKAAEADGIADEAGADARRWLERAKQAYAEYLPEPGAWTSFAFLGQEGYEGYVWDWSKNQPVDGTERLGLLDHMGGNPMAALVVRLQSDPTAAQNLGKLLEDGWQLLAAHAKTDDAKKRELDQFAREIAPLGGSLLKTLGTKFGPALADGQVGMVLDGQATTRRVHGDLPQAVEPLPLVEPAILLPLADRKLFVEGLNDVFQLLDEVVVRLRKIDPDAIPAGYEIPQPVKRKLEGGTVWTFPLSASGLDDQIQPAIVVGDDLAAFTLVPGQASRLLAKNDLTTAAGLGAFGEPAAGAAAVDWSRLVDAVEPWILYLTRYGSVQQREGRVDPSLELGPGTETPEVSEALEHVDVVLDVARCLRAAAATTTLRQGALVTHWRNQIRDLPAK